ncbi:uncharacterized protein J4E92_001596 [Alternaria infectoria]|uniref:uncharacterized protein n=1 Tax=Alternaria infectoria TaxID=45303 RepID=UPI00221FE66F|nr:uncharacterized protein J4E92_001596 [Alternaria infectoria]KAI4936871.1 hypothetical protein J4E92_001596 [Alternaria infectoria]
MADTQERSRIHTLIREFGTGIPGEVADQVIDTLIPQTSTDIAFLGDHAVAFKNQAVIQFVDLPFEFIDTTLQARFAARLRHRLRNRPLVIRTSLDYNIARYNYTHIQVDANLEDLAKLSPHLPVRPIEPVFQLTRTWIGTLVGFLVEINKVLNPTADQPFRHSGMNKLKNDFIQWLQAVMVVHARGLHVPPVWYEHYATRMDDMIRQVSTRFAVNQGLLLQLELPHMDDVPCNVLADLTKDIQIINHYTTLDMTVAIRVPKSSYYSYRNWLDAAEMIPRVNWELKAADGSVPVGGESEYDYYFETGKYSWERITWERDNNMEAESDDDEDGMEEDESEEEEEEGEEEDGEEDEDEEDEGDEEDEE